MYELRQRRDVWAQCVARKKPHQKAFPAELAHRTGQDWGKYEAGKIVYKMSSNV